MVAIEGLTNGLHGSWANEFVRLSRGIALRAAIIFTIFGSGVTLAADASRAFQDILASLNDPEIRSSISSREPIRTASDLLVQVQEWLIWTGNYNGTIDGSLGEGTSDAIRKFQSSIGSSATGALTVQDLRMLADRGSSQSKSMGFSLHVDATTGVKIGIPKTYLTSYRSDGPASSFESNDKKAMVVLQSIPSSLSPTKMREALMSSLKDTSVTYSASRRDWFVIAGSANSRQYYFRFQKIGGYFCGFLALYDDSAAASFANALTMMSLTLDTRSPGVFSSKVSNFEALLGLISKPSNMTLSDNSVDAVPLAQLTYDGKTKVSTTFRDLTVTLDGVKSPSDASLKDPIARLNFADGRSQVLTVPDHADENPASEVRVFTLDKSKSFPQVVFTYFWGGAHCCTVTQIITTGQSNNLVLVSPNPLDGGGYRYKDIDGDGNVDLLASDNSFHYAFASYAESITPLRIYNLQDGLLVDVTINPVFRGAITRWLREIEASDKETKKSNGYWAGWVATKAQLGQFREAWVKMLASYDRETTWSMQECLQGPLDNCPAGKVRDLEFPEALAKHLLKTGYISASDSRDAIALSERKKVVEAPRQSVANIEACTGAKPAVERIVGGQLIGRKIKLDDRITAISAEDNFTLDGVDDKIGKTICSVTVSVDLRALVSELANRNEMRAASQMGQLAAKRGTQLSRRVRFTVQPTSNSDQTWVTVLQ